MEALESGQALHTTPTSNTPHTPICLIIDAPLTHPSRPLQRRSIINAPRETLLSIILIYLHYRIDQSLPTSSSAPRLYPYPLPSISSPNSLQSFLLSLFSFLFSLFAFRFSFSLSLFSSSFSCTLTLTPSLFLMRLPIRVPTL